MSCRYRVSSYTSTPSLSINSRNMAKSYERLSTGYSPIFSHENSLKDCTVFFSASLQGTMYDGGNQSCACPGDASITKPVMTYMDNVSPSIVSVTGIDNTILKAGDTVNLEVKFDEPIRFADDSAAHNDLYVNLAISGISSDRYPKAMLEKLDTDTVYFSYTVPSDQANIEQTITGVDFSPIMQECNLAVVFEDENFTLSTSGLNNTSNIGYTRATSYITDIAGNGMRESNRMYNTTESYIDTKLPAVTKISTVINANNSDVKEALDSTDTDNSDLYLGVGDSIKFGLTISEVLDIENGEYTGLTAATNIEDQDGKPVTLTSTNISTISPDNNAYGLGPSKGKVTYIDLDTLTIAEGIECTDPDGIIRIKSISFSSSIYDFAKNKFAVTDDEINGLNTTTVYIDTQKPEIATTLTPTGGIYSVIPYEDKSGFCFPFEIKDTQSGTNGLTASFKWDKGADSLFGDMYEFAVTASPDIPSEWESGSINSFYSFKQVEGIQYLHIRQISGRTYELLNTSLIFTAADYAGNKYTSSDSVKFNINTIWDNTYPVAKLGNVKKELTDTGGVMTISVNLTETSGLNEARYSWSDTNEQPSAEEINNIPNGDIYEKTSADITITQNVADGEDFNKYLWIKVSDLNGNEIIYNLGRQRYNLGTIEYYVNKSEDYKSSFEFTFITYDQEGVLLALHPVPDTQNEYYACTEGSGTNNADNWYKVSSDDRRSFTVIEKTDTDNEYLEKYLLDNGSDAVSETFGYRNADIVIYIISGVKDAFSTDENGHILEAGMEPHIVSEESYTMRLVSPNKDGLNFYPDMQITTQDYIPKPSENYYYYSGGETLSTLEGLTFNIDLGEDRSGWDYDAIDFESSYFEVFIAPNKFSKKYKLSKQQYQSFTLQEDDYITGIYGAGLILFIKNNDSMSFKNYDTDIYVDSRAATGAEDFGIDYLQLTCHEDNYNTYKTGITEQKIYPEGDIIYLPSSSNISDYIHIYTLGAVSHGSTGIEDFYYDTNVLIWNVTAGQTEELAAVNTGNSLYIELFDEEGAKNYVNSLDPEDPADGGRAPLCLIKNTVNVIAVRTALSNGKKSEIKYYSIYPSSFELSGQWYTQKNDDGSLLRDDSEIIYTPIKTQSMDGIRIYAASSTGDKKELIPQADGTYRCDADPGDLVHYLHAVNMYGSIYYIGNINTMRDNEAPIIYGDSTIYDGANYTVTFRISDLSLKYLDYDNPIKLKFTFDEEYSKRLGYDDGQQASFDLSIDEDLRITSVYKKYSWETEDISNTGIYKIEAQRTNNTTASYMDVTVYGVAKYSPDENEGADIDFNLTVEATDKFGYTGSYTFENVSAKNTKPSVIYAGTAWIKYERISQDSTQYDRALTLPFNVPVRPKQSWILPDPEGYKKEWTDAFPVTKDGPAEISFYDIFGTLYVQDITFTDIFGEYGLDLTITPETYTKEVISITASMAHEDTEKAMIFHAYDDDGFLTQLVDVNGEWLPAKSRTVLRQENGEVKIFVYDEVYSEEQILYGNYKYLADILTIHIDNMIDGAPQAEPHIYLDQFGEEYTADEFTEKFPDGIATTGNVEVWYKTSRYVQPIDETGEKVRFKYGDTNTSYLFKYVDDFGNEGSLAFDLKDYGITFAPPPEPYKDESAPTIVADIYAKLFDNYTVMGAFSNDTSPEDINKEFENIGYVQGYSMKIGVTDYSSYKIVILNSPPASLTYSDAESDDIDGVSISGNTITISKDITSDFTVAVVDNASSETAAAKDNYSYVTVKKSDLESWFDTTKPTAEQKIVPNGLYEQIAYIKFADTSDDGTEIDPSTIHILNGSLEVETDGEFKGWYKKIFTENSSSEIIFQDHVGNLGDKVTVNVSGIDTNPPTITTSWTPPYITSSGEADTGRYTEKTVNTSVYAHMTANKAIDVNNVKVTHYTYDNLVWTELTSGDINDIPGCTASYTVNTEGITVCFEEGGIGLRFNVPAPNGKSTSADVYLPAQVIDKIVPKVNTETTEIKRSGYDVPYAVKVKMTPDKSVYCSNYGTSGKLYDDKTPLEVTINQNGTSEYIFTDKAGNRTVASVTVNNIDQTAPKLTLSPDPADLPVTDTSQTIDVTSDENCTLAFNGEYYSLTANVPYKLSFSKKGVYTVTATDLAGNESILNIPIGNIDTTPPDINFESSIIRIRQDSSITELTEALNSGVTAWEPETQNIINDWTYDASTVNLTDVGTYKVTYTAKDAAGNTTTAARYVSVYDKNNPGIYLDGVLIEPEGTTVIASGEHEIKVDNIQEIADGVLEPYTVKISKGISTIGQVKLKTADVEIGSDGKFTITPGFYTVSVITQSRKTFRAILFVEK